MAENLTAFQKAVDIEKTNQGAVQPLYAEAALDIALLYEKGDHDDIHVYMCKAQDRTGDPLVWKRVMQGMRDSVRELAEPLQFTGTRHFRETHRARNPLFTVDTVSNIKTAKKAADKEAAEKAARIEKLAAEKKATEEAAKKAAADAEITENDVAQAAISECKRLGLSPINVMAAVSMDAAIIDGQDKIVQFATDLARLHGLEAVPRHELENMKAELDSMKKQLAAATALPKKRAPRKNTTATTPPKKRAPRKNTTATA